jgi:arylsulfatase A-like enzyme/Flp pilus assembly protein TadD
MSRRAALAALALLAALAAGCRRGGRVPEFAGAPVVFVSIDTLRADRLPVYGYRGVATPALDAFAAESVVFENAYSHYPLTLPAHASLLSGLLPPGHGVRDNAGYRLDGARHATLAQRFAAAGYATGGFASSFVLRAETGIGAGFATYDCAIEIEPGASLDSGQRPGGETAALAARWLAGRAGQPVFLFLHLYEPHAPYTPPEPFRSRYPDLYDGEIAATDAILARFFGELRRLGRYERAAIVVAGDHGEGLGEHGERQHGVFLYRATTHVPLLVKLPGGARRGERVARPVGLVDVAPTLLALAALPPVAAHEGRNLFAAPRPGEPERALYAETYYPRLHFGWSDLQALYESRWAYVDGPEPELYDLAVDSGQTKNVLDLNRRDYARLRDAVAALDRPLQDPESVDRETAEKLAALGYLSAAPVRRSGPLPDPKSQRHLLDRIERGFQSFAEARYEEAIAQFRATLAANDQMLDIWAFLARSLHKLERHAESLAAWERVLDLSGGSHEVAMLVANGQFQLRRYAEARELAELARAGNPKAADDLLARIDLLDGREEAAFARMEEAARAGHATEGIAYKLAQRRLRAGRPAEAVALLAPFAAKADPATLTTYGLALSETGRHAEALAALERALAADGGAAKTHEALGIVLLRLDRAGEARTALERALALDPNLPDSWNTLGVARYRLEGPRPAMAAWQRAIALDPEQYEAMYNLGLVAAQAGERAEARRALERFAASAPPERFGPDIAKARAALAALAAAGRGGS